MDTRSALLIQIDGLAQQLLQVERAVQSQRLDANLRARVGVRFDKLLSQQRTQISEVRKQASNNQPNQKCWENFRQLDMDCRSLFEECLTFIQGALARADGVDDGMCLLADNLLDDLAAWADVGWRRFTLLARGELYRDTAEIIRIRFPEVSIWGLPLMAHEFGHFLGPKLSEDEKDGSVYPFQQLLKSADENRLPNWQLPHTKEWYHLNENFADLFATYSLGPAFACSFILLRLNPVDAYQEIITHPTHAKRVHSIFWMLDRMDEAEGGFLRPYNALIDRLRNLWRQGLQEAGQTGSLSDSEISLLESRLKELHDTLTRTTPPPLAYQLSDWQRSQTIAGELLSGKVSSSSQNDSKVSRRDILNAAWFGRLQLDDPDPYRINDIGVRALELYRRIPPRKV
ncbi:MAG TPA: hypothetical protein VJ810_17450 [Blastocatellia bacterium]|nr:hypothetical protein [Blastocatellia bacterium]